MGKLLGAIIAFLIARAPKESFNFIVSLCQNLLKRIDPKRIGTQKFRDIQRGMDEFKQRLMRARDALMAKKGQDARKEIAVAVGSSPLKVDYSTITTTALGFIGAYELYELILWAFFDDDDDEKLTKIDDKHISNHVEKRSKMGAYTGEIEANITDEEYALILIREDILKSLSEAERNPERSNTKDVLFLRNKLNEIDEFITSGKTLNSDANIFQGHKYVASNQEGSGIDFNQLLEHSDSVVDAVVIEDKSKTEPSSQVIETVEFFKARVAIVCRLEKLLGLSAAETRELVALLREVRDVDFEYRFANG